MSITTRALFGLCLLLALLGTACSGGDSEVTITTRPAASVQAGVPATAEQPAAEPQTPATAADEAGPMDEQPAAAVAEAGAPPVALHPFLPAAGRARVVALDPGHGGEEVGAAGAGVAEKDVNLRIARRLRDLLQQDGFQVVLTRDGDQRAVPPPGRAAESGRATRVDLQARIDIANQAGADVFISIHNNGSPNASDTGTEVWWDGRRPFAAYNQALAEQVLASLVGAIRGAGYPVLNRGLKEDSNFRVFQGRAFPIFVLGPPRTGVSTSRATLMPAVLGEALFLSNAAEAQQLARDDMQTAIARGYRDGLLRYFRLIDSGALTLPATGLPVEAPNYYDLTPPPGTGNR